MFHVGQLINFGINSVKGRNISLLRTFFLQLRLYPSKGNLSTSNVRVNIRALRNKRLLFPRVTSNSRGLIRIIRDTFRLTFTHPTNTLLPTRVRVLTRRLQRNKFLHFLRNFRRNNLFLLRIYGPTFRITRRLASQLRRPINNNGIPIRITSINLCPSFLRLTSH